MAMKLYVALGMSGLALVGCRPLPILGGPTPETTETACDDGSYCPNPFVCSTVPGRCESPDQPGMLWTAKRHVVKMDAGADAQP